MCALIAEWLKAFLSGKEQFMKIYLKKLTKNMGIDAVSDIYIVQG